ncbi:MAG TPA: YafY family protein [Steroidobacteraceae bacterium]|jgi:predicted DNA-binding transcriptional regulator YafY|nr:YafY family protein [Steroidobacteraceae bacterium]
MRASRLISILMTLQTRGRVTAEALAAEFEVSVRTIYRDVDELSASGVPVYADRGPGGGFQLREGYRTRLTGLTPDEADTLLLTGLSGPAGDLGLAPAMISAERKILAALPASHAARAIQARRRVLLDPSDWYRRVERASFLPMVAQAVWAQTRLSVRYQSWTGRKMRVLEPWGLVIKAGIWYVVGCVNQSIRTFRVGKIEELKTLSERFEVPADFDLASHWVTELRRFERELQRAWATVRVAPPAMSRIERLGADAAEAIQAAPADTSGRRTAIIPIEGIAHAAIELLGFGTWIEVIKPAALRRRVHELGAHVARLHRGRRAL